MKQRHQQLLHLLAHHEWIGIKDLETDTIIYGLALLALSRMKEGTV